jgi:tRNA (uracil-5-)-methyltransferase
MVRATDTLVCLSRIDFNAGDGLAQSDREDIRPWVVVVPFTLPGERVRARVFRNERMHSMADFIEIIRPNPELRDDARIKCKYFAQCGGCQYQVRIPLFES